MTSHLPATASSSSASGNPKDPGHAAPIKLPFPFSSSSSSHSATNTSTLPALHAQGAEAIIYSTNIFAAPSRRCALKYRPPKAYRHPTLDKRLTRHRLLSEARALLKCRRAAVAVPAVYALDADEGWLALEWIEGEMLRTGLERWMDSAGNGAEQDRVVDGDGEGTEGEEKKGGGGAADEKEERDKRLRYTMRLVGLAVGKMHAAGVVHGDLTTSNLMLRPFPLPNLSATTPSSSTAPLITCKTSSTTPLPPAGQIILIDFGLATQSVQDEDRAVDLYVLERAFTSTHPAAETLFHEVLVAYRTSYKGASPVLNRLEDVRMRGRKRSMLG